MKQNKSNIEQALAMSGGAKQRPEGNGGASPAFDEILQELTEMMQTGRAPEGFDIETAAQDPAFADLMADYPADAAARIYVAEKRAEEAEESAMQRMSARVQSRRGMPKSQRGAAMAAPENDYANMSSESFRELLASLKKTARNGGRTRL